MENTEHIAKLQMMEQQANHFQEQLKVIDQQVHELGLLKENVEKLGKSNGKEMFSEVGKGIYIKGELKDPEMMVDVGNKIFVPKTSEQIEGIIDSQIKKFDEVKEEISQQIDQINKEVDQITSEIGKSSEDNKKEETKDK